MFHFSIDTTLVPFTGLYDEASPPALTRLSEKGLLNRDS